VLRQRKAGRLLISGADPSVTKADLARRLLPRSCSRRGVLSIRTASPSR